MMKQLLSTVFLSVTFLTTSGMVFLTLREQQLVEHVKQSIEQAEKGISKLTQAVLAVNGMTSHKVKHFLNNVCALENTNYFEIGVWKGATFTAALFNNENSIKEAVAVDNWSEFGGPSQEFEANCKLYISPRMNYKFYNHDSFAIDKSELFNNPIDIYFYDGNHLELAQELAFTYYDSLFADSFIAVVDDWNEWPVKSGTKKAFEKLGYTILFERELPAGYNGDRSMWWNGLYVAVIRRNSK